MSLMTFCFVLVSKILFSVTSTSISELKDTSPEMGKFFSDVCGQTLFFFCLFLHQHISKCLNLK